LRSTAAIVKKFEKLLVGGIWCIITLEYFLRGGSEGDRRSSSEDLKPIQMPNMDMEELFTGREGFHRRAMD
jgi:ATP-dependent Lon protease